MGSDFDIVPRDKTSNTNPNPKQLPLEQEQAPYLLYFEGCIDKRSSNDVFTFFSMCTGNCFRRRIPALSGRVFIGSQYGWLATVNSCYEPSLFNPISQEEITLPSLTTWSNIRTSYNADSSVDGYFYSQDPPDLFDRYQFDEFNNAISFQKIVVSSEPSTLSYAFDVAAIVGCFQSIAIARAGDDHWTLIDSKPYRDLSFRKDGSIICLTGIGALQIINFDDEGIRIDQIAPGLPKEVYIGHKYIVHDEQDGVFKITRRGTTRDGDDGFGTFKVKVFKLTTDDKEVKTWTPVESLGGRAIFLGSNAFVILSVEEVHGAIQPDCIYFTDDWWDMMIDEVQGARRDLIMYRLQHGRIELIVCPIQHVLSCWSLPIWFH